MWRRSAPADHVAATQNGGGLVKLTTPASRKTWCRVQALLALGGASFLSILYYHFRVTAGVEAASAYKAPTLSLQRAQAPLHGHIKSKMPKPPRPWVPPSLRNTSVLVTAAPPRIVDGGATTAAGAKAPADGVYDWHVWRQEPLWPLFWVLTAPANENSKCQEIISSWGQQVPSHSLLFVGASVNQTKPSGHRFIALPVDPAKKALKEFLAWQFVTEHFPERNWYVKADDDTYFVINNLNRFLETLNPALPYFLGCKFHLGGPGGIQYVSGGAGYVLSRVAAGRLAPSLPRCIKIYSAMTEGDLAVSECLQTVGVVPEDTRDERGRQRFHAFPYSYHVGWYRFNLHVNTFWYHLWTWGPAAEGMACCGDDTTVSFHYMSGQMRGFVWPPDTAAKEAAASQQAPPLAEEAPPSAPHASVAGPSASEAQRGAVEVSALMPRAVLGATPASL